MNCEQAWRLVSAYLDSELESVPSLEIARHLEACPGCRGRFNAEARIEAGIAAILEREGKDPAALARISRFVDGLGNTPAPPGRRTRRRRQFLMIAAVLLMALGGLAAWRLIAPVGQVRPEHVEMDLAAEVSDHHRRFLEGKLVPVPGSDSLEAANDIFRRGLPFRCELRAASGIDITVEGALCCKFRGTPAACLKARLGGDDVSLFAIDAAGLDRFPMAAERFAEVGDEVSCRVEGRNFVMARSGGVVVTAIGAWPPEQLFALVRRLTTK
jgi:hypothetical protein